MRVSVCFFGSEVTLPMEFPPGDNVNVKSFVEHALNCVGIEGKSSDFQIMNGSKTWSCEEAEKVNGTLQMFGVVDDDMIIISRRPKEAAKLKISDNKMSNLISSIRIPKDKNMMAKEKVISSQAKQIFDAMKANPAAIVQVKKSSPFIADIFEKHPNDYGAFVIAYRHFIESEQEKMKRLENGETDQETQQMLADAIRRKNLDKNKEAAYDEIPEAFTQIHMLYIKVRLNGHDCVAFVDTGAQTSLITPEAAERCNLTHLINSYDAMGIIGVGGKTESAGRIWRCDMEVSGHQFPVSLTVLNQNGSRDILLGLDIMVRHHAVINLQIEEPMEAEQAEEVVGTSQKS